MRLIRTLPGSWAFVLGLILLVGAVQLGRAWSPALAAPAQHGQILDQKSDTGQADTKNSATEGSRKKGGAAAGNGASGSGKTEGILVAEILLLMIVGRVLGEAMQRIGQPALMGTLLAGIILGPSLFGWLWPSAQHFIFPKDETQKGMIDGLSQVGILMLLLLTGMETDLKLVKKSGAAAIAIALCGIAFPFACGFLLGQFGPAVLFAGAGDRLVPSLFLGTALSISSIKIVAMVVREMHFMRRNLGQVIVATAIMEDTCGWVIIAITFGIAGAGSPGGSHGVSWLNLAQTVGGVALFLLFCFTAGRWLVFSMIRWVNDNFRSDFPVITAILVIMGALAGITQLLGVRTVLGAFMAGVLIGESPILTGHIQGQLRGMITAFFMPIFFGMSGLAADLTILKDWNLAALTLLLVAIASIGKFSGAFAGAMIGRLSWREGIALGCAMNARGSTEVIVASIGLSMGALSQNLYTMIVTMAVVTTMAMPPMLRAALKNLPMSEEEEIRIAREAIDQKGFLPRLERLLLAADQSPVGRMAARLAGLIAGGQGMPVTILKLKSASVAAVRNAAAASKAAAEGTAEQPAPAHVEQGEAKDMAQKELAGAQSRVESGEELKADPLAREVKAGAKKSAAKVLADEAEPDPEKVHLTARVPVDAPAEVIKDEARKGYDLMFIGLENSVEEDGNLIPAVTQLAAGFEGPMAVYANEAEGPLNSRSRLLVPVNGSPQSRRGAEIAFALARATGAQVRVLFVSQTDGSRRTRLREERVLKDMAELGERYDVAVTTRISARSAAPEAILKEARRNFAMIVMGVSARAGEELFFGNTATQVLKGWKRPILLLAS
jgi:Kef-type K+ transport system membrane component KefB/nucleotide-binding universal stress UspA family protein